MNDLGPNGVVVADEIEPGHLVPLGWRDEGLGCQQVRLLGKCQALRKRELETGAMVEGVTRERSKARVPHESRKEGSVDHHRRAAHIARPGTMWSHPLVAVNANGDGLCIAKTSS